MSLLASVMLAGCLHARGSTERVTPQIVPTPVAAPCLDRDEIEAPPTFTPDAVLAALPPPVRYLTIFAEREASRLWANKAGPALEACTR
ncbi:MAG TPA: hypothetical protein VEA79_04885 [Phenylobacterium sp.]|nr:hypothetical protein [Phenylobacterium sp.]